MKRSMKHLLLNATCEDCGLYGSSQCANCSIEQTRQNLIMQSMVQQQAYAADFTDNDSMPRYVESAATDGVPDFVWDSSDQVSLAPLSLAQLSEERLTSEHHVPILIQHTRYAYPLYGPPSQSPNGH